MRRLSKFQMLHAPLPDIEALDLANRMGWRYSTCIRILDRQRRAVQRAKDIEWLREKHRKERDYDLLD